MASILDQKEKKEAQSNYAKYKRKIDSLKRKALLGDGNSQAAAGPPGSGADKSRQGLDKLNQGRDMLMGTEEVGQKILSDLAVQKETIKRSTQTMKDTNSELSVAQKLANKMSRWWRA